MSDGGDVLGVLGWGLRRYAWVVAVFVLGVGLLLPWLLNRAPTHYDAQAQVGPTDVLSFNNLDPLPRLGESVFTNGAVAATIRTSVDPRVPAQVSVIPQRVELVTAQDNVVFMVVGHGSTPRAAARYANLAATTFTEELNKYAHSVGSFAVQKLPTPPASPVQPPLGSALAALIGVVAGLLAGVGAVVMVLAVRRPVLNGTSAEQVTGARAFGRLRLARSADGMRGLPQLCHRLRVEDCPLLLVAGPHRTSRLRQTLVNELARLLSQRPVTIIDGPTQWQVAERPDSSLVLLVVPEGIGHTALVRQAEKYLDGGRAGVVLVRGQRWRPFRWRPILLPARSRVAVASAPGKRHSDRHMGLSADD